MRITISYEAQKSLARQITRAYPNTCCGFIFGLDGNPRVITTIKAIEEFSKTPSAITPSDILNARSFAEQNHLHLLGTFHSVMDHRAVPGTAHLLKALPGHSILLASFRKNKIQEVRSWRLQEGAYCLEEKILVEDTLERIFRNE